MAVVVNNSTVKVINLPTGNDLSLFQTESHQPLLARNHHQNMDRLMFVELDETDGGYCLKNVSERKTESRYREYIAQRRYHEAIIFAQQYDLDVQVKARVRDSRHFFNYI
jgi:hypothetical protein